MTDPSEATVDALLRQHFAGPVPDQGFSDAVMRRLPRRRQRIAWPLWAGGVAGSLACWLGLFQAALLRTAWRDWVAGDTSAPALTLLLAAAGLSALAGWWAIAEAER